MAFDTTAKILITGDATGLEAAMNRAQRTITQHTKDIEGTITAARNALSALGVGLSLSAVAVFAKNILSSASALDDMAEATGASVEGLSKLADIARISGKSVDEVQTIMVRLNKALSGSDDETKGAAQAIKNLGLNFEALKTLSPDKQIEEVAKAFASFADGAGKTSNAVALFGKQGAAMLPILKDIYEQLGRTSSLTAEQAAQAEKLQKNWNALTVSASNLARTLLMDVVPALNKFFEIGNKAGFGGSLDVTLGRSIKEKLGLGGGQNIQEEIRKETAKLYDLIEDREKSLTPIFRPSEAQIENQRRYIAALKELASIEALAGVGGQYGNEARLPAMPYVKDKEKEKEKTTLSKKSIDEVAEYQKTIAKEIFEVEIEYGKKSAKQMEADLEEYYLTASEEAQRESTDKMIRERSYKEQKAAEERAQKESEALQREFERATDGITNSLTDALMRGFEGGKDWAKNFIDTLKNLFASLVLRPIIEPIARQAAGSVVGMLGIGSANASTGGASSALGGVSNLSSLGSVFGGGGLFSSATLAAADTLAMTGTSAGLIAADTLTFGAAGGASTAAALGATGTSTALSALGAIGTVAPYLAAAYAIYSAFKPKRGGPKQGGFYATGGWAGERWYTPNTSDAMLQESLGGLSSQYQSLIGKYGSQSIDPNFIMGFDTDPLGTAQNRVDSALIAQGRAIQVIAGRQYDRGDPIAALSEHMSRMLVAALRETDLSPEINAMLDAIDPATAGLDKLNEVIQTVGNVAEETAQKTEQAFEDLNKQLLVWQALIKQLSTYRTSLSLSNLSPLSPADKLSASRGIFTDLSRRSSLGDQTAMGELTAASQEYLQAARAYYASGAGYVAAYNEVVDAVKSAEGTAQRQADITQAKIDEQVAIANRTAVASETMLNVNTAGFSTLSAQLASIDYRLAALQLQGSLNASAPEINQPAPSPYWNIGA